MQWERNDVCRKVWWLAVGFGDQTGRGQFDEYKQGIGRWYADSDAMEISNFKCSPRREVGITKGTASSALTKTTTHV